MTWCNSTDLITLFDVNLVHASASLNCPAGENSSDNYCNGKEEKGYG